MSVPRQPGLAARLGSCQRLCAHASDRVVAVDARYFRPAEVATLLGDPSKARQTLGWVPVITAQAMYAEMVAEDLKVARRHAFLKAHGHDMPVAREGGV